MSGFADVFIAAKYWPAIRAGLDAAQDDHEIMRAVLNLEQFVPIYAAGLNKALQNDEIRIAISAFIQLLRELHANK